MTHKEIAEQLSRAADLLKRLDEESLRWKQAMVTGSDGFTATDIRTVKSAHQRVEKAILNVIDVVERERATMNAYCDQAGIFTPKY